MYAIKVLVPEPGSNIRRWYVALELGETQPRLTRFLAEAHLWAHHSKCESWLVEHQQSDKILQAGEIIRVV